MLVDAQIVMGERIRPRRVARLAIALLATAVGLAAAVTTGPSSGVDGRRDVAVVDRGAGDDVPDVQAGAYAVFDMGTGEFLAARDLHGRRPVASLMKLLTAAVVMEAGDPAKTVVVPDLDIASDESNIGLRPGEQQRRDVLVRAMLIVSANDAARALAADVGGTESSFVEQMNEVARALDLRDTRAENPVGLDDDGQFSSAHDVVMLGSHLMRDPTFRAIVERREASLHGRHFGATNDLLGSYEGADGIKTGRTSGAGWCILASATRDGRRVIVAVLGAPDEQARDSDASLLLDWAFGSR